MFPTHADYTYPFGVPRTYFDPARVALIPLYPDYIADYHVHFLRYIYYMCYLNAEGSYPSEMTYEELEIMLNDKVNSRCKPRIKKILIAEAPNVPATYFYNSTVPFIGISPFTTAVRTCLFPGRMFINQVDFLMACAAEGFLLLDLFPYAIYGGYSNTGANPYRNACKSAFCGIPYAYPINIINTLNSLICCIDDDLSLAFALIRFGNPILSDAACVTAITTWLAINGKTLVPIGAVDIIRPMPIAGASNYLRVVGQAGPLGPSAGLLAAAGF